MPPKNVMSKLDESIPDLRLITFICESLTLFDVMLEQAFKNL